jgi:GntR family transcriptional regulator
MVGAVMPLDDQTSRPLYRQVADDLRGQIRRQELMAGGQLPTEARLMDEYGVSRNTIRLALGLLRNEGLVITGQGRGSFVADVESGEAHGGMRIERHVNRHSLDSQIIEFGEPGDADRIDVTATTRVAPPVIAEALRIAADARVLERRRVLYRDAQPTQTADTYLPEDLADDDVRRPSPLVDGVAAVLERAGRRIVGHADEVTVRMPSPGEAQQLQIATGVPVMVLVRTAFDATESPVCATVVLLPGDRHMLRYHVAIDNEPPRNGE